MGTSLIKDQMTPKERMEAFISGKSVDRFPCIPLITDHAGFFYGIKISDYNKSAKLMAESHLALYRKIGFDSLGIGGGWKAIAEAFGSKLVFPDKNTPYVSENILKSKKDIDNLHYIDPEKDGRLPIYLEALEILVEKAGKEVDVEVNIGGPLSLASAIYGTDNLLREFIKDHEFVNKLLEIACRADIAFSNAIIKRGGIPWASEPVASSTVISPEHFKKFPFKFLKKVQENILTKTGRSLLHICGNTEKAWEIMADADSTILSLDELVDLTKAKEKVGKRAALMGNIKPTNLLYGTPSDVKKEAFICLNKAADNPKGFILSSGCAVPIGTPSENLKAMVESVRTYKKDI
jgi:uroporphyrinogen decarboxylase